MTHDLPTYELLVDPSSDSVFVQCMTCLRNLDYQFAHCEIRQVPEVLDLHNATHVRPSLRVVR